MIPLELEIRNFLSYRAPAKLDLRDIHVACISGRNGAGKSSILEAMIWALFGKSRAPSEEDLVNRTARLAGEHMEVRFVFALGNTTYRILRRRRKSDSVLEFALATEEGDWLTLTEGGKRETQAAIDDTLRMSYETFVNASFLQQGQADAFTTQTPARRKEILADVLGVQVWEQHRARFSVRRRDVENASTLLLGKLEDAAEELALRESREAELAAALAAQANVEGMLAAQTALREQARRTAELRKAQLQQQAALTAQMARLTTQRNAKQADRDRLAAQQAADEALLADAEEISARHAQWRAAEQARRQWEEAYRQVTRLRDAQAAAEREVVAAAADLHKRIAALEATEKRLANQVDEESRLREQQAAQQAELATAETRLAALQEASAALQEAERTLQQRESEQKAVGRDLQRLTTAAAQAARQKEELAQLKARRAALEADVARLETAQRARQALLQRSNELQGHIQALQAAQPRLKEEMDGIKDRLDRLDAEQGGACPLCGQALTDAHRRTVMIDLQEEGRLRGDAWRTNRQQLSAYEEERRQLEAELATGARDEGQLVAAQRALVTQEARVAELTRLQTAWTQEGAVELAALESRGAELASLLAVQRKDVDARKGALADRAAVERTVRDLRDAQAGTGARLVQMAQETAAWAAEGRDSLAGLRSQLEEESFAAAARARAADFGAQIAALAYDPAAHETAGETATALADAEAAFNRLQAARSAAEERRHTLALYARQLAEDDQSLASFEAQLGAIAGTLAELGDEDTALPALDARVAELQRESVDAIGKVAHARSRVDTLLQMAERERTLLAEREALQRELGRLQLLEKACSRDGVQALLIEHALPDIEDRTNQLLERLTGGEMSIVFDTQRALKTREGLRETLDIRIIDRAGERPYENYSGGEQFRVNFAIRLALSQALAHRSGAALSTLVIDEGFGSQDPQGRDRLVEAIHEIQDEFARILVITHVEELKDAFPARIEVEKQPAGSVIAVSS